MKEIITLQLGHHSNHLATHFWNTQESYFTYEPGQESPVDHDVHWRPGIGADGSDTFMPRTLIYDLKGGFGSLSKINALYEPDQQPTPASSALWNGRQLVQRLPRIPVAEYQESLGEGRTPQQLVASKVRFWSDYNRVFYHPKSLVQLSEYELHSTLNPFDSWAAGEDLFQSLNRDHDLVDRDLRPFVEEADQMQGMHVFTSLHDAWSGFASTYMQSLRDDYPKSSIWVWGVQHQLGHLTRDARMQSLMNMARGIVDMSGQASLLLPIGLNQAMIPPSLDVDMSSTWHTSAILSAAVETATLPSRLKPDARNFDTLDTMAETLTGGGKRTLANLMMQVGEEELDKHPHPHPPTSSLILDKADPKDPKYPKDGPQPPQPPQPPPRLKLDLSFATEQRTSRTYLPPMESHIFARISTFRGFESKTPQSVFEPTDMDNVVLNSYHTSLPFPILDCFPATLSGYAIGRNKLDIPIETAALTDKSIIRKLDILKKTIGRYLPVEEREAITNDISELAEEYKEGWSSGSDEFDD